MRSITISMPWTISPKSPTPPTLLLHHLLHLLIRSLSRPMRIHRNDWCGWRLMTSPAVSSSLGTRGESERTWIWTPPFPYSVTCISWLQMATRIWIAMTTTSTSWFLPSTSFPPPHLTQIRKHSLTWNFRGFQTPKLIGQATNGVKPFQERRKKIFMAGTLRYHSIRRVLGCKATYRQDTDKLDIITTKVDDYLVRLNNSKFCLAPRGIAGWAPRGFDAIAMGCIPIFISDYTIFPFQQQLDYSR